MKKWAILFGLFLVTIIVLADTRRLGFIASLYDFPYGDKIGHFFLYGLLTLLVSLAVFEARPHNDRTRLALVSSSILALLIGLEEWSQRLFPSRHSSISDLLASYAGVVCFAALALRLAARRGKANTVH